MSKRYSIQVSNEVYEKLKKIGHFGESYNKVILRLLNSVNEVRYGGP